MKVREKLQHIMIDVLLHFPGQVCMFRRHQVLLPFMVAVELLVREGKMTHRECQLLSMELGGLEVQLDSKLREEKKGRGRNGIPAWISRKVSAAIDSVWIMLPVLS